MLKNFLLSLMERISAANDELAWLFGVDVEY